MVPLTPSTVGFPKKIRVKHRYCDILTIAASSGTVATYQWSCNGMYDPDITGTGHQPSYFDNFTAVYDHYTVFESMIRLEVIPTVNSRGVLYIDDDTSAATLISQASEQTTAQVHTMTATTNKPFVFVRRWDGRKFFGGNLFDNDNLQGTSAANPTEQSYFTFLGQSADGVASVNFLCTVTLEYTAVWDELKTAPLS